MFADLSKTFFLVHKIKNLSLDLANDLTTLLQELEIPGKVYPQHPATPLRYVYYIRRKLYTRRVHNSFTESVDCDTYRQAMNNFKLRTKYGTIH